MYKYKQMLYTHKQIIKTLLKDTLKNLFRFPELLCDKLGIHVSPR